MSNPIELGLDTFGDVTVGTDGQPLPHATVLRNVVKEAVLADQVGLAFFGVGEHHRPDFAISAPEVMLAAIAGQTERIHLGTAVTVLSSDDPVRVFQRFGTLDAISNGRAEIILGRGSFTESFPLFGYDLAQYGLLFEEKLDLFVRLIEQTPVTWSGRTRSALTNQLVYPSVKGKLKTWVGVGGTFAVCTSYGDTHCPFGGRTQAAKSSRRASARVTLTRTRAVVVRSAVAAKIAKSPAASSSLQTRPSASTRSCGGSSRHARSASQARVASSTMIHSGTCTCRS